MHSFHFITPDKGCCIFAGGMKTLSMALKETPTQGHTFPDMLSMVPDLMSSFIFNLWPTRGDGIRVLRLVSKEVGCNVSREITSFTVTLGDLRDPISPERLAMLLGGAQLHTLGLFIVTWPGEMMCDVPSSGFTPSCRLLC